MTDALVRLLNSYGYQPFRLPMTGLEPPEVYTFDRQKLVRWGPLNDFLTEDCNRILKTERQLPDIEHKYTSKKSAGAAVSFLESVLNCIGISSIPKLDLSFCSGRNIVFAFTGVKCSTIDLSKLAPLLENFSSAHIPEKFVLEGRLHVAYEYVFANKLLMQSTDFSEFENINKGNVGEFIKLGSKGKVSLENQTTITFSNENDIPAAFAYKSGRLMPNNSTWEFFPLESTLALGNGEGRNFIPARGVVLDVESTDRIQS